MLKYLFAILFLFTATVCFAQSYEEANYYLPATDYNIEQRAFNAPDHISTNKYQLTQYLIRPYRNDYDKLRVIAYWIASHLAYDNYKYDNGRVNLKEMRVNYDILRTKAGICTDFAQLFADMANIANVHGVEIVSGYVLQNAKAVKQWYRASEMPKEGHAWNKVTLSDGRKFFVDTTYMSRNHIGAGRKYKSSLKHKLELQKRMHTKEKINEDIDSFYFDFTPRQELKRSRQIHVQKKFVR